MTTKNRAKRIPPPPVQPAPDGVTYAKVWHYCCEMMGSISMLEIAVKLHPSLRGEDQSQEQVDALYQMKDKAVGLVLQITDHSVDNKGIDVRSEFEGLVRQNPEHILNLEEQKLWNELIQMQYGLQRLMGEPEGPVPVRI